MGLFDKKEDKEQEYNPVYEAYIKEANKYYTQACDQSGARKKALLKDALNVLNNVPDGYGDKDRMVKNIQYML